jgi:hypothetical protein
MKRTINIRVKSKSKRLDKKKCHTSKEGGCVSITASLYRSHKSLWHTLKKGSAVQAL